MSVQNILMGAAGASAPAAGITFVGGLIDDFAGRTTDKTTALTNLTGGVSSAPAAGDLVIVYLAAGSTVDRSLVVAGYTVVADLYANSTFDVNLTVAYKFMGSTPDTSLTVTGGSGSTSDAGALTVHVWRNVDPVLPFDVLSTTATATGTTATTPPAITPVTPGSVIVTGGARAYSETITKRTFTSSSLENFRTAGSLGTNDIAVGMGSVAWTSGTYTPASLTYTGTLATNQSTASVTMALRPVSSATKPTFINSASAQRTSNGNTISIAMPTDTQQGDLMIAFLCSAAAGGNTWTGDTGWTEIVDQNANPAIRIAYKVAGSGEAGPYTFTHSASSTLSGAIVTFRNATYDAVGSIVAGTNPVNLTGPTAAAAFSVLLGFAVRTAASITITKPGSMTTRVTDNDATSPSYIIASEYVVAGATGTRSFDGGGSSAGILMTIKPA